MSRFRIPLLLGCLLVAACGSGESDTSLTLSEPAATEQPDASPEPTVTVTPPPPAGCEAPEWESVEDLGRLFVATPGGPGLAQSEVDVLASHRPGGVLIRSYAVSGRDQLTNLLADIHANGETLTLVDHEGGDVQLPAVEPRIPSPATMGRTTASETAANGSAVGNDLKTLGFDVDLAPVADVRVEGFNTVTSRSFGTDPVLVSEHVLAFAGALEASGIVPAVKHFPGYGKAVGDAHLQLTTVGTSREELEAVDFPPFREAIAAGVPIVLTSHLHYSALDPVVRPATISPEIITGLLREQFGFNGVVITDSLGMGAITLTVGTGEGAVLALAAGADLLLLTDNITTVPAYAQGIQDAVDEGRLSRERVLEALGRVAALQRLARGGDASCLEP
ncbi:MAG TPA: glycoside hydrolase family 3 N-terminal domain-containing protein [Dehalococcoidia bacterium]|nr:glycoside hydrolase family 3 N-terminal domain-containing protein [Dehalococcoidia bacterium]